MDDSLKLLILAYTQSPQKRSSDNTKQSETTRPTVKGVTPELKEFLDHYETFVDKYIAFMKKYESSDDAYGMLSDYLDILQEYSDFAEQLDQYDTDKMSAADSAYYLEVTTRVAKKLYAVAIQ